MSVKTITNGEPAHTAQVRYLLPEDQRDALYALFPPTTKPRKRPVKRAKD